VHQKNNKRKISLFVNKFNLHKIFKINKLIIYINSIMNIFYNASDIAALINKNPYKTSDEIIHNILCKIKKVENKTDINKFKNINNDDTLKLLNLFNNNNEITKKEFDIYKNKLKNVKNEDDKLKLDKEIIEKVSKKCINTEKTNECIDLQKYLENNIDKILDNKNTKEIKDYINGFINKKRGLQNEGKIIQQYSKKHKTNITDNNSKLYKLKLFSFDLYNIYICGKIDGIENDELIEVKNRKNRLFSYIPEYETIQIEVYFKLTGLKKGKLIQNYNDEQSIILIEQNNELWDLIETELKNISEKIILQL
jgi:hypothetical protein